MRRPASRAFTLLSLILLVLAACRSTTISTRDEAAAQTAQSPASPTATTAASRNPTAPASHPDGWEGVTDIPEAYDPFAEGDPLPDGFRQLLKREDILPIYAPLFVAAGDVDWPGEELVLGVFLEDEARAYPIGMLNQREIVIDRHHGIPTLVTW